jgi:hypothetical protein
MGDRRRRTAWLLLAAALLPGLVGGCASIPDSGSAKAVRQVKAGDESIEEPPVQVVGGPLPGSSRVDVVEGFLAAAQRPADGYAEARQYILDGEPRRQWQTSPTEVYVVRGMSTTDLEDQSAVRVTGTVVGVLTPKGVFSVTSSRLDVTLPMRRSQQVWLIEQPPRMPLISEESFRNAYRPVPVYYQRHGRPTVVPDLRWVADQPRQTQPTTVVTWLLDGPSPAFAPVVRSAFPDGTRLRGRVVQDGGDLVVDLSAEVLAANPSERTDLSRQLVWTLRGFLAPGGGVRVLANGQALSVPNISERQGRDLWRDDNPTVAASQTSPYYVTGSGDVMSLATPLPSEDNRPTPSRKPYARKALSAAMTLDGEDIAVVRRRPDGRLGLALGRIATVATSTERLVGSSMSRPSWGGGSDAVLVARDGQLWSVPVFGSPARVDVSDGNGRGPVDAVAVAPDGVRAAVIIGTGSARRAYVGQLVNEGDDRRLSQLRPIGSPLVAVRSLAWSDETSLALLASAPGRPPLVWTAPVDGAPVLRLPGDNLPANPESVAAAPDTAVFVEDDGRIFRGYSEEWLVERNLGDVARSPFYPG